MRCLGFSGAVCSSCVLSVCLDQGESNPLLCFRGAGKKQGFDPLACYSSIVEAEAGGLP